MGGGLRLDALLTEKEENSLVSLVGVLITTVTMMEWQLVLLLKALIRIKYLLVVVWNIVF
jgi:hypothetical protein